MPEPGSPLVVVIGSVNIDHVVAAPSAGARAGLVAKGVDAIIINMDGTTTAITAIPAAVVRTAGAQQCYSDLDTLRATVATEGKD
jgi:hypothetical protein